MTFLDEVIAVKKREAAALPGNSTLGAGTSRPSFDQALRGRGLSVVAEIKRRSPSKGVLAPRLDPRSLARSYAKGGAAAISCLTDREFFGAESDDLAHARGAGLPVLRKDFIIDERQVEETARLGASALLLIVRILEPKRLEALLLQARKLGLDALVEVHDEPEIEIAVRAGAAIVGVNNRNLDTLTVDPLRATTLRPRIPAGILTVAESGVRTRDDVARVEDAGFDAVLVGEALAAHDDPETKLRELRGDSEVRA
jgi:indole-3-glycerol phosphate synthase